MASSETQNQKTKRNHLPLTPQLVFLAPLCTLLTEHVLHEGNVEPRQEEFYVSTIQGKVYIRDRHLHCVLLFFILSFWFCHVGKKIVYGKYSVTYVGRIAKNLRVNIGKKEIRVHYFKVLIKLFEQSKDAI